MYVLILERVHKGGVMFGYRRKVSSSLANSVRDYNKLT